MSPPQLPRRAEASGVATVLHLVRWSQLSGAYVTPSCCLVEASGSGSVAVIARTVLIGARQRCLQSRDEHERLLVQQLLLVTGHSRRRVVPSIERLERLTETKTHDRARIG